ncbi:LOW QUALITY PROTEIN: dehydrogenase/reductase SDR family member 12 [Ara ararauna]
MGAKEEPAPLRRQRHHILVPQSPVAREGGNSDLFRTSYESASKHFSLASVEDVAGRSFLVMQQVTLAGLQPKRHCSQTAWEVGSHGRQPWRTKLLGKKVVVFKGNLLKAGGASCYLEKGKPLISRKGKQDLGKYRLVSLALLSRKAMEQIPMEHGKMIEIKSNIFLHILDISNPKEIWKFAEIFKIEHNPGLKICSCPPQQQHGSSTYILTTALLPLLEKAADTKLITVSSGAVLVQHTMLNIPDLSGNGTLDETMVYAQNKSAAADMVSKSTVTTLKVSLCLSPWELIWWTAVELDAILAIFALSWRQQVVLTEQWGKAHRNIHFSVMHPSWADTPGNICLTNMKNILCTETQGAVVWVAVPSEAMSGLFFQARQPVPTHLPLASTHSPLEDKEKLMEVLEQFSQKFKSTSART